LHPTASSQFLSAWASRPWRPPRNFRPWHQRRGRSRCPCGCWQHSCGATCPSPWRRAQDLSSSSLSRYFSIALALDVPPVGTPFVLFRAPGGDDASLGVISVGVDDRNLQAIDQSDGIYADFAIVETVIHSFDGRPFENPRRIFECNPMQLEVAAVLLFVPTILHIVYLHNVN